jgi:hypothetical protein
MRIYHPCLTVIITEITPVNGKFTLINDPNICNPIHDIELFVRIISFMNKTILNSPNVQATFYTLENMYMYKTVSST